MKIASIQSSNDINLNTNADTYSLRKFESTDLKKLKPLMDKAAGYETSLEDELEYFKSVAPMNWFYLCQNDNPLGYIRCFPQGNWGTTELFVDLEESTTKLRVTKELLKAFTRHTVFEKGFRLRFEIPAHSTETISLIKEFGFTDRIESFFHYEKDLLNSERLSPALKGSLENVAPIKSAFENLHPVSEDEITEWIISGNVYVHQLDSHIASAAQVYIYGNTAEINRIATNPSYLRRGSALALLNSIHSELAINGVRKVILKVDEQKHPARALYEKIGYQRIREKDQVWLSKIY